MPGAQKTSGHLVVSYPGQTSYRLDLLKEFEYNSDVMQVGDTCSFKLVAERDGSTLTKLRTGSLVKLYLSNLAVNGGRDTLKHLGRIIQRTADCAEGTVDVVSPDLGWHLMNCSAPLWTRLRGLTLEQVIDPIGGRFIDPTFGFQGLRAGFDANLLNRTIKQGRAGTLAFVNKVLTPVQVIQVEPGETFHDLIVRYCMRFNLLVNVSADGYLQVWNPDYSRPAAYAFYRTAQKSNILNARRVDDASTRYTQVKCVGEIVNPGFNLPDFTNPNAKKTRGVYNAPTVAQTEKRPGTDAASFLPAILPFTNRLTFGDGEMFTDNLATKEAEWRWKRGLFDSHYLEITVDDHWQGGLWYESDQIAEVNIPELQAQGRYYVVSAHCSSTAENGDVTTLILRWPELQSASFGVWSSPPTLKDPEAKAALQPGSSSDVRGPVVVDASGKPVGG